MKRGLSVIFFFLSLVVLVAVFILNYRQSLTLLDRFHAVEESHGRFTKINDLASMLRDIQRSHRGYVISHHKEVLIPYHSAAEQAPEILRDLAEVYKNNPNQAAMVDTVTRLFNKKIGYVEDAIDMIDRGQFTEAMNGIQEGRLLFDSSMAVLARMSSGQRELYEQQKQQVERQARRIFIVVITGLVVSALLLVVATARFQKRKISRLSNELEVANREVEATNLALLSSNRDLKQANDALKKLNQELNDFSYSVSHDLKAPLRAIRGFCDLLSDEASTQSNERITRAAAVIEKNAKRMDALINDLLQLARLGNTPMSKQNVDMNRLIDEVLRDQALKPGTEMKVSKMENAHGDPGLLKQVWENLISNAIKFSGMKDKPVIEIGYKQNGREQAFWVKDNGVGFDPQYRGKLFKVFSRLHTKEEFEGTGAGLAIVKKIIDAHKGNTWAEAELANGATFYFTLPLNDSFPEKKSTTTDGIE